jgi:hypothetical protein
LSLVSIDRLRGSPDSSLFYSKSPVLRSVELRV